MSVGISKDKRLWPMILEKAIAKMQGNYYNIAGSYAGWGVRHIYGTPRKWYMTKYMSADDIWNFLTENLAKDNIVTATSNSGSDTTTDKWGIV